MFLCWVTPVSNEWISEDLEQHCWYPSSGSPLLLLLFFLFFWTPPPTVTSFSCPLSDILLPQLHWRWSWLFSISSDFCFISLCSHNSLGSQTLGQWISHFITQCTKRDGDSKQGHSEGQANLWPPAFYLLEADSWCRNCLSVSPWGHL